MLTTPASIDMAGELMIPTRSVLNLIGLQVSRLGGTMLRLRVVHEDSKAEQKSR